MKNKELHSVRFSKEQVNFIELMIYGSSRCAKGSREDDILSTIKKSVKKDRGLLTEGKTLSNVKNPPTTNLRPISPPGQGKAKLE